MVPNEDKASVSPCDDCGRCLDPVTAPDVRRQAAADKGKIVMTVD
jgi:hypothetical protein